MSTAIGTALDGGAARVDVIEGVTVATMVTVGTGA
jgi:hypothetical protein